MIERKIQDFKEIQRNMLLLATIAILIYQLKYSNIKDSPHNKALYVINLI